MRSELVVGVALVLAGAVAAPGSGETAASVGTRHVDRSTPPDVTGAAGPLRFVENAGQMSTDVAFAAVGRDRTVLLGTRSMTLVVADGGRRAALEFAFEGARAVAPRGEAPTRVVHHYFHGKDAAKPLHARTFSSVAYEEPWPGVALRFDARTAGFEYSVVVGPGADVRAARFRVSGATGVERTAAGELAVTTGLGTVRQSHPIAWQEIDGSRMPVDVAFDIDARSVDGTWTYGFRLGLHDRSRPVIVDPNTEVQAFATGLQDGDTLTAIALDATGNVYAAGRSRSPGAVPPAKAGLFPQMAGNVDAWLGKFDPSGQLLWATFLGGTADEKVVADLAVDLDGEVVLTGTTNSSDFPVTRAPLTSATAGVWVTRVATDGAVLVYSQILGGTSGHVALMLDGTACVAWEPAAEIPATARIGPATASSFGAVVKLSRVGTVVQLTDLRQDVEFVSRIAGVAVDPAGSAFLVGTVYGGDSLPPATVTNAFTGASFKAFALKLDPAGVALEYALFVGGKDYEEGISIAADSTGAAYVVGTTSSPIESFPVHDPSDASHKGAFIAKITPAGEFAYVRSLSSIGGVPVLSNHGVAVDASGRAYVNTGRGHRVSADGKRVDSYESYMSGRPALLSVREFWVRSDRAILRVKDRSGKAPSGLQALATSARQVRLWWLPEDDRATSYTIERAAVDGAFGQVAEVGADTPFVTDGGLAPDTAYRYAVTTVTPDAWSGPTSPVEVRTLPTIDVRVRLAQVIHRLRARVHLKASIRLLQWSPDGAIDPSAEAVRVTVGTSFVLDIPAGSPGWTRKGTSSVWKGPYRGTGSVTLQVDAVRGRVSLRAAKVELGAPSVEDRVVVRVGDDVGSAPMRRPRVPRVTLPAKTGR